MIRPVVLKISGHQIDDPVYLDDLAQTIAAMSEPVIVVHGGGKEISQLQQQLGITPQYVDGVRVTDEASLALVTMVLCGTVNKRLVLHLLNAGINALGLSGIDMQLVHAEKMPHESIDMGYTGAVSHVNTEVLYNLLDKAITPVIAPPCYGSDSHYNVNGDHVAGAIASALQARKIIFLSNVEGVLDDNSVVPRLTPDSTTHLIESGVIYGGMIPKVEMALAALATGIESAVITSLAGLQTHGGTVFTKTN